MATIANWNGHTFEVSPSLIRGFTDLSIKGSCETTVKNSNKQKYEQRKYGESPEISMTIGLNALTGVTDVFAEAMQWVEEAAAGKSGYFYMGSAKLIAAKMLLKSAEVTEVVTMPGNGGRWISCDVKVTFRQGAKNDSGGGSSSKSSGSSGGSKKASVKTKSTTKASSSSTGKDGYFAGIINKAKEVTASAKKQSSPLQKMLSTASKTLAAKQTVKKTTQTSKIASTGRGAPVSTPKATQN